MWMIEQMAATFADHLQQTRCGCSCEHVWASPKRSAVTDRNGGANAAPTNASTDYVDYRDKGVMQAWSP
jgi:hypothetical protein